jgi:hypothetical protein
MIAVTSLMRKMGVGRDVRMAYPSLTADEAASLIPNKR